MRRITRWRWQLDTIVFKVFDKLGLEIQDISFEKVVNRIVLSLVLIFLLISAIFVSLQIIIAGYSFEWTGFGSYSDPNRQNFERQKTLWDWMSLLIIPVVLGVSAYIFNRTEKRYEFQISEDKLQETILQSYYDNMAVMLLENGLRNSQDGAEVRVIARARTLTALQSLNGVRKGALLQFLREAKLIESRQFALPIVDLRGADLSYIELNKVDMSGVNLEGTDMHGAKLRGTDFEKSSLRHIDLRFADMSWSRLKGVDLGESTLAWAKLVGARMLDTNLSSCGLIEVDFTMAVLEGVDLRSALLNGANLSRTGHFNAVAEGALYDKYTKWPSGFDVRGLFQS